MAVQDFQSLMQQGNAAYADGRREEAIAAYQAAIEAEPEQAIGHYNLGVVLRESDHDEEALASFKKVLEINENAAAAWNNLGILEERAQHYREAIPHYRRAVELQPQFADAHFNLGMVLLRLGEYREGWVECEWRWQTDRFTKFECPQRRWLGRQVPGTLLVHTEQGAGDVFQFARFLPLAAERCEKLLVIGPANLHPLLKDIPGVGELREAGQIGLQEFLTYCPIMTLPLVLDITLDNLSSEAPYLQVPESDFRLPDADPAKKKIGIVWAGSHTHANDIHRSCKLTDFEPLLDVPDTQYYSLLKGPAEKELQGRDDVIDLAPMLNDFGDTANAIDQLDLVIAVDTAVVHLAGALGKPAWLLVSQRSDWRWMEGRDDTPWYPTVKLFRQNVLDDWSQPVAEIRKSLQAV